VKKTPEQIKIINEQQKSGNVHPYTCGNTNCRETLVATENGWICLKCGYTQDLPASPISLLDPEIDRQFRELAEQWKRERPNYSSSITLMIACHPYLRIISLGQKVVPSILAELERNPDFWFSALRAITDANPITDEIRGKLIAMKDAWIAWGKANGYRW
jgi:hypothetical protein